MNGWKGHTAGGARARGAGRAARERNTGGAKATTRVAAARARGAGAAGGTSAAARMQWAQSPCGAVTGAPEASIQTCAVAPSTQSTIRWAAGPSPARADTPRPAQTRDTASRQVRQRRKLSRIWLRYAGRAPVPSGATKRKSAPRAGRGALLFQMKGDQAEAWAFMISFLTFRAFDDSSASFALSRKASRPPR